MYFNYTKRNVGINNLVKEVTYFGNKNHAIIRYEVKRVLALETDEYYERFTFNCHQILNSWYPAYLHVNEMDAMVNHGKKFLYGERALLSIQCQEGFFTGLYFPGDFAKKLTTGKYYKDLFFNARKTIYFGQNSLMLPHFKGGQIER
jgi:hypothetical protein